MKDIVKLILAGLIIGLLFSALTIWVLYVWQLVLMPK